MAVKAKIRAKLIGDLLRDVAVADAEPKASLSLVAKWLPRERGRGKALARTLALEAFGVDASARDEDLVCSAAGAFKKYRKLVSALNGRLDAIEVKMCGKRWRTIDPKGDPWWSGKEVQECAPNKDAKEDPDRIACAAQFETHVAKALKGEAKVHGRTLYAHQLAGEYFNAKPVDGVIEAQWQDLRSKFSGMETSPLSKFCVLGCVWVHEWDTDAGIGCAGDTDIGADALCIS